MINKLPRIVAPSSVATTPSSAVKLSIDIGWCEPVKEACTLKDALDHAIRWPKQSAKVPWIVTALASVDFRTEDFSHGRHDLGPQMPSDFVKNLLGSQFFACHQKIYSGWVIVPSWSVMGWVRKDRYQITPRKAIEDFASIMESIKSVEQAVLNGSDQVSIRCIGGIPLFFALEGKNRAQLYRLAKIDCRSECHWYSAPNVDSYVAAPLAGMPDIMVLKGKNIDGGCFTEILPFVKISKNLLVRIGVRWSSTPSILGWFTLWQSQSLEKLSLWQRLRTIAKGQKAVRLALLGFAGLDQSG